VDEGTHYNEEENKRHKTSIPTNQTRPQLEGIQETAVPAGENEVRSNTRENKDAFMEAILQRFHGVKSLERCL
jgi:hypothetical protein